MLKQTLKQKLEALKVELHDIQEMWENYLIKYPYPLKKERDEYSNKVRSLMGKIYMLENNQVPSVVKSGKPNLKILSNNTSNGDTGGK